jgi:hypothetical protein
MMQLFENAILGVVMLPAITSTKENVLLSYYSFICYLSIMLRKKQEQQIISGKFM